MIVPALRARRHMPAEPCGSAGFDRAHHFELIAAQMPGIVTAESSTVIAEDIRDLQPLRWHWRSAGSVLQPVHRVERARHIPDRTRRDMGVLCRGREFGVAEQYLDHPDIGILFQQMRREAVP